MMSTSDIKMNNGNPKGKGRSSITWTQTEDDVLVEALQALHQDGIWQPNASLKDKHLSLLETMMKSQLHCLKPKSRQEILGRANWLKKRYFAAKKMVSEGGFSWDEDQMMLVGDGEDYKTWAKFDKAARGLYHVPFPNYHSLEALYGNVVVEDKVAKIEQVDADVRSQVPNYDQPGQPRGQQIRYRETSPNSTGFDRCVRARDSEEVNDSFAVLSASVSAMGLKISGLGHKIDDLIAHLSEKKGVADLQAKLVKELKKIRGLEDFQVFRAINVLAMKHDLLRVFFTMPEDMKKSYIVDVIRFGL